MTCALPSACRGTIQKMQSTFCARYIEFRRTMVVTDICLTFAVLCLLYFVMNEDSVAFWLLILSMSVGFNAAGVAHHSQLQIVEPLNEIQFAQLTGGRVKVFTIEWSTYALYLTARYSFEIEWLLHAMLQLGVILIVLMIYIWLQRIENGKVMYNFIE